MNQKQHDGKTRTRQHQNQPQRTAAVSQERREIMEWVVQRRKAALVELAKH